MPPPHDAATVAPTPGRPRGRPPGGQLIADRDEILAAAMTVVRRLGPDTTMNAIAAEAGVTKPIIYRSLGSKADVARAISDQLGRVVEEHTTAILAQRGFDGGSFRATARAFFELMANERELFLFTTYGWPSNDGDQLEAMIERSAERFVARFQQMEHQPHPSPAAARTWGLAMVGALRTLAVFWVKDPYCDIEDLVDQVDTFFNNAFFNNAFRPRQS